MKSLFRASGLLMGILVFSACTGEPPKIIIRPEDREGSGGQRETEQYEMMDYQDAAAGRDIPEWIRLFMDLGIAAVEAMETHQGVYVFIGTNRGTNFNALSHWAEGFTAAQDFPRLAAVRIEQRLTRSASLYPDDEYGEFFEQAVKNASDAVYPGAVKEASFWMLRRLHEDAVPGREQYDFFTLVTIDKEQFQAQVNELLNGITPAAPPTRDQAAAVHRIRETFFEGF